MNTGVSPRPPVFLLRFPTTAPARASESSRRTRGLAPWCLSLFATVLLIGVIFCAAAAYADLKDYAPAVVTVTASSAELLAADNQLKLVELTNTGTHDVWFCHGNQTAVVGSGFFLPVGSTRTFTGENTPQNGLKAIASGGSTTVAVGRG